MTIAIGTLAVMLAAAFGASACTKKEAQAQSGEPVAPPLHEGISKVDVPGETRAPFVVEGNPSVRRPIIYLHGMCASPKDDLDQWGDAAKQHGTIIAVMGDAPCPGQPGMLRWSMNAAAIDERIEAAVRAVNEARGLQLEPSEMTVIGESMGAARAELLATKFPEKYTRLVLVGSPQTPSPNNLKSAKAVATLAGQKEDQTTMKKGASALEGAGLPARFWMIPNQPHGEYGVEGARLMDEALSFVAAQ